MRTNRFRRFIASLAVSTMLVTNITSNVAPLVVYAENAAPVQAEQVQETVQEQIPAAAPTAAETTGGGTARERRRYR